MRSVRIQVIAFIVAAYGTEAVGQPPPITEASISPQEFRAAGADATWRRPPEVTHILLHGCGGGGGGTSGTQVPAGESVSDVPGLGGGAAPTVTLVLTVKSDTYTIKVGGGGPGNNAGADTTFKGSGNDVNVALPGGAAGMGPGQTGSRSPFAAGGTGGAGRAPGNPAGGPCAGGGGAALPGVNGGAGGPGFVVVYPLPDLARFSRVLSTIEKLSSDQAAQPEQPPGQNSPPGSSTPPAPTGAAR